MDTKPNDSTDPPADAPPPPGPADGIHPLAQTGPIVPIEAAEAAAPRRGWAWRIVHWPFSRILIAATWIIAAQIAGFRLLAALPAAHVPPTLAMSLGRSATVLLLIHIAYQLYIWVVERRHASELSLAGAPGEAARGLLIGALLMTSAVGVLWVAGFYHVVGHGPARAVAATLGTLVLAAYGEEMLLRLIFFRLLEEMVGTTWALGLSAVLFGVLHGLNPHATPISILSIALAGALLGAAFASSRRMWLPLGLHFGWNFFQGSVFGVPVSGIHFAGLLVGSLSGPPWLSGGPFGVEGSLLSVLVCAVATVPLLRLAVQRGHWVESAVALRRRERQAAQ